MAQIECFIFFPPSNYHFENVGLVYLSLVTSYCPQTRNFGDWNFWTVSFEAFARLALHSDL